MLAESLRVRVGDTVSVVTPTGTLSRMGLIPKTKRLQVAGIFRLGLYEFDAQWGFVTLNMARHLVEKKDQVDCICLSRQGHVPGADGRPVGGADRRA